MSKRLFNTMLIIGATVLSVSLCGAAERNFAAAAYHPGRTARINAAARAVLGQGARSAAFAEPAAVGEANAPLIASPRELRAVDSALRDRQSANAFSAIADPAERAAAASRHIDNELQMTARHLTNGLEQAFHQQREAERLGQPRSVANRFGSESSVDQFLQGHVNRANAQLGNAFIRDRYVNDRRWMENTRNGYLPGTDPYNRLSSQMRDLDLEFANQASMF